MPFPKQLQEKIDLWLEYDQNEQTRNEILELCKNPENEEELHKRMDKRIQFGTAGLRSSMEAGWSRMNTLTVLQASQGLCSYIKKTEPTEKHSIVIGHDHRYHSKEFAEITAKCFLLQGFKVYYLNYCGTKPDTDVFCHTPLVPFAINTLKAGCGVMVTASHNPANDNGFKVYYKNGCQIIPPHDNLISEEILQELKPQEHIWDSFEDVVDSNKKKFFDVKDELLSKYIEKIAKELVHIPLHKKKTTSETPTPNNKQKKPNHKPWFVYTPMHGVGYEVFKALMDKLGLYENEDYLVVEEQKIPDPAFPTVSFPNPEEKGALDLSMELAKKHKIRLVLANDPDADRFSVASATFNKDAELFHSNEHHGLTYSQLNGNEIGYLFAYFTFCENHVKVAKGLDGRKKFQMGMLNSTVSSSLIKYMAQIEGFVYKETLTGFKWIGNKALELEKNNPGLVVPFAYEEAIGYMFPKISYDKDGISALVVFLQLYVRFQGSLDMTLNEIYEKYGFYKQHNDYYILPNPKVNNEVFAYIREHTSKKETLNLQIYDLNQAPIKDDCFVMKSFRDLTLGLQTGREEPDLPVDPNSEMITFWFSTKSSENHLKVTLRGSGTEPKLKVYIECMNTSNAVEAQRYADYMWESIKAVWIRPDVTGLHTRE
ncbi:hypothetical protein ACO0RG_003016 [Hanseniaspora osmophila]